jgi:mannose/fructose-specific phosphotransferase system component IIA
MIGIVLISHGEMAKGIYSSASMFVSQLNQVNYLALWPGDNPDDFQKKLETMIQEVDSGDGVFILADMLGGTPCNRAMYSLGKKVRMLTGLSFPMLYSLLTIREETNNIQNIAVKVIDEAKNNMVDVNAILENQNISVSG